MTSRISHTTIDSRNAYEQSVWWCQVLGFAEDPRDPNLPGHEECMIFSADGRQRVLFIEVPEGKTVKNRVHFDLWPTDGTMDEEVERLLAAGRDDVAGPARPPGSRHGLGHPGRSRGQRVLRPAQRGRAPRPVRPPGPLSGPGRLGTGRRPRSPQGLVQVTRSSGM